MGESGCVCNCGRTELPPRVQLDLGAILEQKMRVRCREDRDFRRTAFNNGSNIKIAFPTVQLPNLPCFLSTGRNLGEFGINLLARCFAGPSETNAAQKDIACK